MEYLILPVILLISLVLMEIATSADSFIETMLTDHHCLHRVEDNWDIHLMYSFNYQCAVWHDGIVDDDEDVFGHEYTVCFTMYGLTKAQVPVANYYFYPEKPYKNRKEIILWQDNEELLELNYYDKLVKKIMTVIIQNRLKKRSLELAKSTSA